MRRLCCMYHPSITKSVICNDVHVSLRLDTARQGSKLLDLQTIMLTEEGCGSASRQTLPKKPTPGVVEHTGGHRLDSIGKQKTALLYKQGTNNHKQSQGSKPPPLTSPSATSSPVDPREAGLGQPGCTATRWRACLLVPLAALPRRPRPLPVLPSHPTVPPPACRR